MNKLRMTLKYMLITSVLRFNTELFILWTTFPTQPFGDHVRL